MSAMTEDVQPEQIPAQSFPVPLCDEEDGPAAAAHEPEHGDSSDDDVDAHGGGGSFNSPA
jgi:hypothetical protein